MSTRSLKVKAPISDKREALKRKPRIKLIKQYPKEECVIEGCTKNAVGKGDICKKHGGDPVIKENLLRHDEIPDKIMACTRYDAFVHPRQYVLLAKEGLSEVEIAAAFQISIGTMRDWAEKFFEFNEAYEIGQAMHEAWWLREGKENLDNRGYNTGLFKFLTGNKLGYSDKIESKNLMVHAGVLVVPEKVSLEEWEAGVGK